MKYHYAADLDPAASVMLAADVDVLAAQLAESQRALSVCSKGFDAMCKRALAAEATLKAISNGEGAGALPTAAQPLVDEWLILFHGQDGKELVGVKTDATVVIFEHGAEQEAAEVFWGWIGIRGKTLIAELAEAKAHIAAIEAVPE